MLDKLKIRLKDFEVNQDSLRDARIWGFKSDTGKIIKYYSNVGFGVVEYYPDGEVLIIQFNPYQEQIGVSNISHKVIMNADENIKERLRALGVSCHIEQGELSRLDLCRDAYLDYPVCSYQEVIKDLPFSRMKLQAYNDGFILKNTQHQLCMYNKIQQLKKDNKIDKEAVFNWSQYNVLRAEIRLFKNRKIKDYTGLQRYEDVISNLDYMPDVYNKYQKKEVFKMNKRSCTTKSVDANIINKIENALGNEGKIKEIAIWRALSGDFFEQIKGNGGVEYVVSKIAESMNLSRMQKSRLRLKLREMLQVSKFSQNSREQVANIQLYKELKNKLVS